MELLSCTRARTPAPLRFGHFAELAAGVLLEQIVNGLHGLRVVLHHRAHAFLAPPDRRPERDAPGANFPFVFYFLQLSKQIVAELRQLDVVGHVKIDHVHAHAAEAFFPTPIA